MQITPHRFNIACGVHVIQPIEASRAGIKNHTDTA